MKHDDDDVILRSFSDSHRNGLITQSRRRLARTRPINYPGLLNSCIPAFLDLYTPGLLHSWNLRSASSLQVQLFDISNTIIIMSDGFNANPTIRNASDLPSRRRQITAHQPSSNASLGLLTSTIPPSAYIPDPFSPSPSWSDGECPDEDADPVEPIDEQEIYGAHSLTSPLTNGP